MSDIMNDIYLHGAQLRSMPSLNDVAPLLRAFRGTPILGGDDFINRCVRVVEDAAINETRRNALRDACEAAGLLDEHGRLRTVLGTPLVLADGAVVMYGGTIWRVVPAGIFELCAQDVTREKPGNCVSTREAADAMYPSVWTKFEEWRAEVRAAAKEKT